MNTEELIKIVLEDFCKLQVVKIPESDEKTPDYLVMDGKYDYLIEVKEKEDSLELKNKRDHALTKG